MESNINSEKLSLGDEMKNLEQVFAGQALTENLPILVRIDGKGFSKFTKSLKEKGMPFNERFAKCMQETTAYLIEETQAKLGYTQSDEITLVYFKESSKESDYYNSKIQKLTSIIASHTTGKFNQLLKEYIPEKSKEIAFFDARVWNVPDLNYAAKVFLWREKDAIKNSISMAASSVFQHKLLLKKTSAQKIELLKENGIIWNDYPEYFKRGAYFKRVNKVMEISEEHKKFLKEGSEKEYIRCSVEEVKFPLLSDYSVEQIKEMIFKVDELALLKKTKKTI